MHFSGSLDYKVCAKFAQVVDNTINYSTQIHFAFQNYNQGQEAEYKTTLQNITGKLFKTRLSEMNVAPDINNHLRSIDLFR